MAHARPGQRPANPHFSSGPCPKRPGWRPEVLSQATVGRSHRSKAGLAKLREAIDRTRDILQVPATHQIAIVPASDTGAVEMALWSMLGPRGVEVLAWEAFGKEWVTDVVKELRLPGARTEVAPYGALPDLGKIDFANDVIFTWNGTTSGVRVPSADFIPTDRKGLTICDATSAVFAQKLDWAKLDVTTFSWQKAMGSEAAHGMLILGPRAIERLETYVPDRPLPKIFRLADKGKVIKGLFEGSTINTPSLLCVEDYLDALRWAEALGGLDALVGRADANAKALTDWVARTPWIDFLAADPAIRTNTSVCLKVVDPGLVAEDGGAAIAKSIAATLETEGAAYDIASYRDAPPGLRIWCGCTVETADVVVLTQWLDWAFDSLKTHKAAA